MRGLAEVAGVRLCVPTERKLTLLVVKESVEK